ncbi:hypothetical protein JL101_009985 [Skermanella rosea]|uniref:hypothetical protein n=1 Tax=Skermanella rosea TaxID=1817965 RepID=UPI00193388B0|nr:hypothetical protein [Skermanella rosea]UEM05739.1 hypothetical protein JL101_009985 [Skermanella rosea]
MKRNQLIREIDAGQSNYVLKILFLLVTTLLTAVLFGFIAGIFFSHHSLTNNQTQTPIATSAENDLDKLSMNSCMSNYMKLAGYQTMSKDIIYEFSNLCISVVFNESALNDYKIRKTKFERQYYAEGVTLWMVVSITISGVMLAALQLMASYRLALNGKDSFSQDSNIALEQGKVSLKSSITGLFILIISFAFFLVYVLYIYTISDAELEKPKLSPSQVVSASVGANNHVSERSGIQLQGGGFGAPPNVMPKQEGSQASIVEEKAGTASVNNANPPFTNQPK